MTCPLAEFARNPQSVFVCILAYRPLAALQIRLGEVKGKEEPGESVLEFLRSLGRVERVKVGFGKEVHDFAIPVRMVLGMEGEKTTLLIYSGYLATNRCKNVSLRGSCQDDISYQENSISV